MSVYSRENPLFLTASLQSLVQSSILPDEIVLVEDGPIPNTLKDVIDNFRSLLPISSVPLAVNIGLPGALNAGLAKCSHELVARFDTDDLCEPNRFERQVAFLIKHPEVAALGAAVQEFEPLTGVARGFRSPPENHDSLVKFALLSSPLNHPAVMFRKSAVLKVGAYPTHLNIAFEDYALWLRLLLAGYKIANIAEVLVRMRAGVAQAERRRGFTYAKQEISFALEFRKAGFFSKIQCLRFILFRVPLRFLPKRLLVNVYRVFGRQSYK
jgi:amylovoran biosynthesis glycosyltransferase AmsE